MAEISASEFAFMLRQAGLAVTEAQASELRDGYDLIRAMAERVRAPRDREPLDREAEPAHLFVAEGHGGR
jgi:hypothetical protein